MIKGLVTIIIPTYNRADYVVEAIESAKAQTYAARQIIVVDDGSSDETERRVAGIEGVEYYYRNHRGQGAARNYGLRRARGEYIASLDADDLWEKDFLSRSVSCLEDFGLDFVFTNWNKIRGGRPFPSEWLRHQKWKPYRTNRRGDWFLLTPAQIRKLFLDICPAPSSSLVLRRSSVVTGWGEQMQIADDWYLLLEMALSHPCTAAFDLTPRWHKRVDGKNVYDGQSPTESIRKLYLHDCRLFRESFGPRLTRGERLKLNCREFKYRLYLFVREMMRSDLSARLKLPQLLTPARLIIKRMVK
jgi:glycosyltransferase involved in cell wall biosynthesis